jgi:hypothetical protein
MFCSACMNLVRRLSLSGPAARLLGEQDMTREDALDFIIYGIVKGGGDTAT